MADFSLHTAAVSAVRFHPKEFVLATGSADRTVRFWDLEQLQPISCTVLEATGVRCITFHPEGGTLFSATQDALRLYTWDPDTVCTDSLPVQWGKPGSVVVFRDQLVCVHACVVCVCMRVWYELFAWYRVIEVGAGCVSEVLLQLMLLCACCCRLQHRQHKQVLVFGWWT